MNSQLARATEVHRRGGLDEAEALYNQIVHQHPDCAEAHHGLAMIAWQRGAFARSVEHLERAIALQPNQALFHASLGDALWADGQSERAISAYHRSLEIEPGQPTVLANLGASLVDRGSVASGVAMLRRAVELDESLASAQHNLARALLTQGDAVSAIPHLQAAIAANPQAQEARQELVWLLLKRGDSQAALPHAIQAVRNQPTSSPDLFRLATVLQSLGRLDQSAQVWRELIRLTPNAAAPHTGLASVLEQTGDLSTALAELHRAITLEPRGPAALARLATRERSRLPAELASRCESVLAHDRLSNEEQIALLFGLSQVRDEQGRYQAAAQLSLQANAGRTAELSAIGRAYDSAGYQRFVEQITHAFTSERVNRLQATGNPSNRPIFIVGLPRSGTSLVEQILASHPQVHGAGELVSMRDTMRALPALTQGQSLAQSLDQLAAPQVGALASRYLAELEAIDPSARHVVDKLPDNLNNLGLIRILFPNARIIHCRRSPRDVSLSCWLTDFATLRWASQPDFIVSRIQQASRLADHWERAIPGATIEVAYESLVSDLEPAARKLIQDCGLEWSPACLRFHENPRTVRTASVAQVRQPVHTRSIGRWKNYAELLPALFEGLPNPD